ncbi:MAG: DUF2070 family protein [Candidatus Micrarchaeia archaeon]
MSQKKPDFFAKYTALFSKNLPSAYVLVMILIAFSIITGIIAMVLIHFREINRISFILVSGTLIGIMALILPTLFTSFIIRAIKQRLALKYVIFLSLLGELYYMIFILAGAALYLIASMPSLSSTIILLGDAGIFAWWLFTSKVIFGDRKKAVFLSLIQPTINLLMFLPFSTFMFALSSSLDSALLKLYGGIAIFAIFSYLAMYVFEKPIKRGLGISGIDLFSQMLQNWLFNFTITTPKEKSNKFGMKADIATHTVVIKSISGKTKAIFFVPEVHFGPSGILGGSNFPYMFEKAAEEKYKAPIFVMHGAVNEDQNPIFNTDFSKLLSALNSSISEAKPSSINTGEKFLRSYHNSSSVAVLDLGNVSFVTFTRAPRITEDIEPAVAVLFSKILQRKFKNPVLLDAHNTRFESAPADELAGVKLNTPIMHEYLEAIEKLSKPEHASKVLKFGSSKVNIFKALGAPQDLAPGAMKVAVFAFNGYKRAMILFNSNNMLPSMRNSIIKHVKSKFGVDAEVYTTDTHYVNSLRESAANVLGRHTSYADLEPFIDEAMKSALGDLEESKAYYSMRKVSNFLIWGASSRERIRIAIDSMFSIVRMMIPILIVFGLIVAAWVISLV